MADTTTKFQFMTLENAALLKELIAADTLKKIDDKVQSSIKAVSQSADKATIYFYTKEAPVKEEDAVFSITLPAPVDINGKADKVKNAAAGNFAGLDANGNLTDTGRTASDFDEAGAATTVDSALRTFIGTIPASAVAKNIVAYIQESVAAGNYDDTTLKALVDKNTSAITILNGSGDGSVSKAIADFFAEWAAGADSSLDTLKEISDWILGHASDAAEMNSNISGNTAAITKLEALVGRLPEGGTAKTIVEYIAEYVSKALTDSDLSQYAKADDLKAAVARIDTLETDLGAAQSGISANAVTINKIANKLGDIPEGSRATTITGYAKELVDAVNTQLSALITQITAAENDIAGLQENMSAVQADVRSNKSALSDLQAKVGAGFEPIPEAKIRALFS